MELIIYIMFNFLIYSFIGWIIEELYHFTIHKNFKKKGFLKGPYKPMYGIAVTMLIICREVFMINIKGMIILCFIIPSVVEYSSGYLLKRMFNEVYWDYSHLKYNIDGFVTLRFSIYWCMLSLIGIYMVQPLISKYILLRFYGAAGILTYILTSVFFTDLSSKICLKVIKKYEGKKVSTE